MTEPVNSACPETGAAVRDITLDVNHQTVAFCTEGCRGTFAAELDAAQTPPPITTRAGDNSRRGAFLNETVLTPAAVKARGIKRLFSLPLPGDARGMEAQPLVVGGLVQPDGTTRDVVFCATMANQIWAYDLADGTLLWERTLGRPITVTAAIDMYRINQHAGIYSTPVIDVAAGVLYACAWISPDGTAAKGQHWLHAVRLVDGSPAHPPLSLETAQYNPGHGLPVQQFVSAQRKQRAALTLTQGAVLIPFGTISETSNTARGWLIAVDTAKWAISATWCSTARGAGGGIWHSGAGPAVDSKGNIYVITGNGDFDAVTDFGNSAVKLTYDGVKFAVAGWWTPYTDYGRTGGDPGGESKLTSNVQVPRMLAMQGMDPMDMAMGNWADQDLGSGGPTLSLDERTLLVSGKDGILYAVDTETMGNTMPDDLEPAGVAGNYEKLRAPPIWYTGYPGPGLSAAPTDIKTLNVFYNQRSHHQHGSPLLWQSATYGEMHLCGGENGALRAWSLKIDGSSAFLGQTTEVASPQSRIPLGGMPGWQFCLSANGDHDAIVWALVPAGDANTGLTPGRLLACEVSTIYSGVIGAIWDSWDWGAGAAFTHPKFNRPVVFGGRVVVPTYDGRVDVWGLAT